MNFNTYGKVLCLFGLIIFLTAACNNRKSDVQAAFYYWKSDYQLNSSQEELLKKTDAKRLYVRFFDVVWNEKAGQAIPHARLKKTKLIQSLEIVPVIYLTNAVFMRTPLGELDSLAAKIAAEIVHQSQLSGLTYQEIQLDCDWTVSTKKAYFSFLKSFKKHSDSYLSATIRLHQIKYPERTGVPPVDKGVLMFYNMGKISADPAAANSIYNEGDAARYLSRIKYYLLPLDIALPVYSWTLQIREGRVIQVYAKIGAQDLLESTNFEQLSQENVFRAKKSFFRKGIYFREHDILKLEAIKPEDLIALANQLAPELAVLPKRNVIYYDLSSEAASGFDAQDLQKISARF